MADAFEILRLLEAERDRYILEIGDLERRVSFIRNQIHTLEALISGYALEEQMYHHPVGRLLDFSSESVLLQDDDDQVDDYDIDDDLEEDSDDFTLSEEELEAEEEPEEPEELDISDIPKLTIPRKPGTLPLLPEFSEYSIQNAILILMRQRPKMHIHIDALVRDLYGDKLTPTQLKTAKTNVNKMLSTGAQAGLWHRVLHAQGVYTLNYEKGVTTRPQKAK